MTIQLFQLIFIVASFIQKFQLNRRNKAGMSDLVSSDDFGFSGCIAVIVISQHQGRLY